MPEPGAPELTEAPEDARIAEHIEMVSDNTALTTINPYSTGGGGSQAWLAYMLVHDRLLDRVHGEVGNFQPALATSWETDDMKTFIFNLRDDVYFHNGDHFTAASVVFTVENALNFPGTEGHTVWSRFESARAIDDYTVELVLHAMEIDIYYEMSLPCSGMFSEQAYRDDPENWSFIGTGPYYVSDFDTNVLALFERFDDHWGGSAPTKSIALRYVPEPSARLIMLENGEIDYCMGINADDVHLFQNNPDYGIYPVNLNHLNYIGFNQDIPVLADRNFRLAVAHALNVDEIAMIAAAEWAEGVPGGTLWGRGSAYRNNSIPNRVQDLDLAKQYLEDSIYNGEEIELSCAIVTNQRAAEATQQQLAAIGINTRIHVYDIAGINAAASWDNNQLEMHIFLHNARDNAGSMRNFFYPGAQGNRTKYSDPHATDLIDRAAVELDPARRQALYYELQEYVYEDPPAVSIFWRINAHVGFSSVGGFTLSNDNILDFRGIFKVLD